jgi:hypothetical protein
VAQTWSTNNVKKTICDSRRSLGRVNQFRTTERLRAGSKPLFPRGNGLTTSLSGRTEVGER